MDGATTPSMIKLLDFGQIKDYEEKSFFILVHVRQHKEKRAGTLGCECASVNKSGEDWSCTQEKSSSNSRVDGNKHHSLL